MSITQNTASKDGGGIFNAGRTVTLKTSVLTGNISRGDGGAIHSAYGSFSVTSSSLTDNHADLGNGGGIGLDGATITINSSTLDGNSAGNGGGIGRSLYAQGTLVMTNSTVSGNSATNAGGGLNIFNANIASSTMALNQAAPAQGGSLNVTGSITLKNSILGALTGGDCSLGANGLGSIITAGGSISSDATCSLGTNDKASPVWKAQRGFLER